VTLGGHPHEWYLLTDGPVVDLDALPPGQAVGAAVDRLLRMGRGEQVELRSGVGLDPVWREVSELCPGGYQFLSCRTGRPGGGCGSPAVRQPSDPKAAPRTVIAT
jgi:hypothetical protein